MITAEVITVCLALDSNLLFCGRKVVGVFNVILEGFDLFFLVRF